MVLCICAQDHSKCWPDFPKFLLLFLFTGTNVDEAKKILAESNLPISSATDLDDAAKKAVASL